MVHYFYGRAVYHSGFDSYRLKLKNRSSRPLIKSKLFLDLYHQLTDEKLALPPHPGLCRFLPEFYLEAYCNYHELGGDIDSAIGELNSLE